MRASAGIGALCFYVALFVILGIFPVPLRAEGIETRVVPFPRSETEHIIADWLKKTGCAVDRSMGEEDVRFTVSQKNQKWAVILRHHSPLATEVIVEDTAGGHAAALWKYLDSYQGYPSSGIDAQAVPAAVLARKDAVVCIRAVVAGATTQFTGFIVDRDGLILGTAHTLQAPQSITIVLANGRALPGRLIRADYRKDLVLIDCQYRFGTVIAIQNGKNTVDMGERVYSIGCPRNHEGTLLSGYIDGPPGIVEGQPLLQVRMEVDPGSSGSPVFDRNGNLVAMVKGRLKGDNRSGLLIPPETIVSFIKEN